MSREAILTESYACGPHTRHFRLELVGRERFDFVPGQYIALAQTLNGEERKRYYSIASPPRGDNCIELCLNFVEEGSFSHHLFGLPSGARLRLQGPFGAFLLHPEPHDALFVATGTGIAPIRSMVHHLLARDWPHPAALLFGVRTERSILYREEFEELAGRRPNFQFVPTLSRPGEQWEGATGYVQEHVLRLRNGAANAKVYVCGLRAMVNDVRGLLLSAGHDPDAILYEKYD